MLSANRLFIFCSLYFIFQSFAFAQSAEEYFRSGNKNFNRQLYTEAIADYRKAIELNPQFAKAYHNLGNINYATQNYEEALNNFSKAIVLSPHEAEPYCSRGALYSASKKYKESLADLEKAITINSGFSLAYRLRASLYFAIGKKEKAAEDWKKAASLGHIGAYLDLKKHFPEIAKSEEFESLEKNIHTLGGGQTATAKDFIQAGNKKLEIRDYTGAIADFEKAVELNKKNGEAYFGLGSAYFAKGNHEKACQEWHKALDLGFKKATEMLHDVCHE